VDQEVHWKYTQEYTSRENVPMIADPWQILGVDHDRALINSITTY
jgi:hypothetical protein